MGWLHIPATALSESIRHTEESLLAERGIQQRCGCGAGQYRLDASLHWRRRDRTRRTDSVGAANACGSRGGIFHSHAGGVLQGAREHVSRWGGYIGGRVTAKRELASGPLAAGFGMLVVGRRTRFDQGRAPRRCTARQLSGGQLDRRLSAGGLWLTGSNHDSSSRCSRHAVRRLHAAAIWRSCWWTLGRVLGPGMLISPGCCARLDGMFGGGVGVRCAHRRGGESGCCSGAPAQCSVRRVPVDAARRCCPRNSARSVANTAHNTLCPLPALLLSSPPELCVRSLHACVLRRVAKPQAIAYQGLLQPHRD